jgi:hypothetical protein
MAVQHTKTRGWEVPYFQKAIKTPEVPITKLDR